MAIPSQNEMFQIVLSIMNERKQLSRQQAKVAVREKLQLRECGRKDGFDIRIWSAAQSGSTDALSE